ncbi:adenylyl-sulfate kinase [Paenibacillus flagellatus]|nr:adenylyl-sulfate kinase [Paenibacillus flagellatus]
MKSNVVVWLTGLSGAGKTTLALALKEKLGHAIVLDGDELRKGLNSDLGFSDQDRREVSRRTGEVAKLLLNEGFYVIVSSISPFRASRDQVRAMLSPRFVEVFVDCPLDICEARDPKGLYRKARAGEIGSFTGISHPYEPPLHPEVRCRTDRDPVEQCVRDILQAVHNHGIGDA